MSKRKLYTVGPSMFLMLVLVAVAVVWVNKAEAGKPRYKYPGEQASFSKPIVVDNSASAFSYYAELVSGAVDVYQVYAAGGDPVQISLAYPKNEALREFTPSLAVVGPGISSNVVTGTLPFTLPQDTGVIVMNYTGDLNNPHSRSDTATMTSVWQGQEYRSIYPQAGPYYIVVWDKQGRGGKYIMSTGSREDFGLLDLMKFPYTWAKLNIWFGNWLNLAIAVLLVLAIAAAFLVLTRRKRKA